MCLTTWLFFASDICNVDFWIALTSLRFGQSRLVAKPVRHNLLLGEEVANHTAFVLIFNARK
jgi:hypothetical protein